MQSRTRWFSIDSANFAHFLKFYPVFPNTPPNLHFILNNVFFLRQGCGFSDFICIFAVTMTQTRSARQELAYIQKIFFRGAGLDKAAGWLQGDERRAYILAQVDRLLSMKHGPLPLAMYLSDIFWTAEEGRVQYDEYPSPLLSLVEQQTLTEREMNRLRMILEIAGLCHDLYLHFTFNLEDAFGIKNKHMYGHDIFDVSNKQLVKWLNTTEYEHIAMHTAYIMKKFAIKVYANGHYQPAQDALAELYSLEYHEFVREPNYVKMPPRDYVKTILNALLQIDRHWQRGIKMKLKPEVIMLHDEIYGLVPRQFDKDVLQAAQELYDYMDEKLCGRLVVKGYDDNLTWDEQAKSVQRIQLEVVNGFVAKVREVRSKYLGKGWLTDDSLAFMYLMAHSERCGYGIWREEDDAL